MIRVTVELESAISRDRDQRLAEVVIYNRGTGTHERGDYCVLSYRKGTKTVQREGTVENHPRLSQPVLTLLRKSLEAMGY